MSYTHDQCQKYLIYIITFLFSRNQINDAILQLTESGELGRLENKWWLDECGYEAKVNDNQIIIRIEFFKYITQVKEAKKNKYIL